MGRPSASVPLRFKVFRSRAITAVSAITAIPVSPRLRGGCWFCLSDHARSRRCRRSRRFCRACSFPNSNVHQRTPLESRMEAYHVV